MSATVDCPYCETTVALLDFQIGQKIACPSCQQFFVAEEPPVKPARRSSKLQEVAEAELERAHRPSGLLQKDTYRYPDRGVLILILGIMSIAAGLLGCLPLFIIPFTAPLVIVSFFIAVPTVVLGFIFMHQIDAGKRDPAGKGMNVAGVLCGVLIFCVFVGLAPGARRRRAEVPGERRGVSPPVMRVTGGLTPRRSPSGDQRWFFAIMGYNACGPAPH